MKNSFSAPLLLLLSWLSVVCQAESLTGRFVVEFQQDESFSKDSFSIKPDQHTLPGDPFYPADTNSCAESTFPPDDHPLNLEGYGVKTAFFESIYWPLIHAAHFLVANELMMTTSDAALNAKPYSRIPLEVFVTVGWLLERYWNKDSPQFNPVDQPETDQEHPFEITTMMLPGRGQQQSGPQNSSQQNPPSASSGQQASGSTTQLRGPPFWLRFSGSGGGNQGPEQHRHTYGFNCYVGSCHGVCQVQPPSGSSGLAGGGQQNSPSRAQRETEHPIPRPSSDHRGDDPSRNTHQPNPDLSEDDEEIPFKVLEKSFVDPIMFVLNCKRLMEKQAIGDVYVHLAAAMCNALGEDYEYIVDYCASCTHTFRLGFCHSLVRIAKMSRKFHARKSFNLHQFTENVIEGLNTDRQALVEKIARREIERVNIILQQGSSLEDKYEAVGNFALIFFALSANKRDQAIDLFWEACFKDADGNRITQDDDSPKPRTMYTTDPTRTYEYVYSSVRNIKDITHLQRLVNQLKNSLIPDKDTASTSCENGAIQ
ncbi:hypothetical protein [Endozoicomonas sp. 8E]|uniref:hypothetical protein n=1 Tax=Endozoicomonas sp. 8E TaxID=3035692 RepID=UPI002938FA4B|nr:hypothetical protein [Endozoicomonas sp. 8E]WOG28475.1 hypothetical protein P6910_02130 [Endozoicomonas sp. 8E]